MSCHVMLCHVCIEFPIYGAIENRSGGPWFLPCWEELTEILSKTPDLAGRDPPVLKKLSPGVGWSFWLLVNGLWT